MIHFVSLKVPVGLVRVYYECFPTLRFTAHTLVCRNVSSSPAHVYTPPSKAHMPRIQSSSGLVTSFSTTLIGDTS